MKISTTKIFLFEINETISIKVIPNGKERRKDKEKISYNLSLGIFFFLETVNNSNITPITPPDNESPGKYGNIKNINGLRYRTDGWSRTYTIRAELIPTTKQTKA